VVTLQQLLLRIYPWLFAWCHLKKNRPTAPDGSSFAHYWITEPCTGAKLGGRGYLKKFAWIAITPCLCNCYESAPDELRHFRCGSCDTSAAMSLDGTQLYET
jgi:hypothetical protein